ncbi:hypothetical protein Tco_1383846 [Tanacetum coccineum]
MKDKVVQNNSQVTFKKTEVEDHHMIFYVSNKTKFVTACNDSLKSRISKVNVVCAACGKCVLNSNHDACVSKFLIDVNARSKKPQEVPIWPRKPIRKANQSVATPPKKTVASDSTIQKTKSYYSLLYEETSKYEYDCNSLNVPKRVKLLSVRTNTAIGFDDDDVHGVLSLDSRFNANKVWWFNTVYPSIGYGVLKVYGGYGVSIFMDKAYPCLQFLPGKGRFNLVSELQSKRSFDDEDVHGVLSLDSRFNAKKVLGLVVQYGVSKYWIWRIEGLWWIRRIHFHGYDVSMSAVSGQFSFSRKNQTVRS